MPRPVKCLIVDDIQENLVALKALLQEDGVEVLTARSGAEALDLLLQHDVALTLLDVQMPEMDGFQLAELMRGSERTRHVPLIFVTAGSRDPHRLFHGYEKGAVDFLYKPIEPHVLKSKAGIFFQLHRQKLQLAEELRERTENLRMNEMFIAVLGHDLRNPLNAIVLSAHGLNRSSQDENVQKVASRIVSSGKRMSDMIEDLLDLARMRLSDGITLQREPTDFGIVVARVITEQSSVHPDRHVEFTPTGNPVGEWDGGRLAQVASNLIGNALQYGESGQPIEVSLDGMQPDSVTLSVANAGKIPPDVLPYLFDPFRGTSAPASRTNGLGLGLYIVKHVVGAHGGSVEVRSGETNRTQFIVKIPRRQG